VSRYPTTMPLHQIGIGKRHRRDAGDVAELARSMADIGLLNPVTIAPDGKLIAGARRIAAAKSLGWKEIPVRVVDLDATVRGEFAENALRKNFTVSEVVAKPLERAAAKQRQGSRTDKHPENFSTSSQGRALDKVAAGVGLHRTTIAKAEAVVDAAKSEPEKFGRLLADMDRTGRVSGLFKRLKMLAKQRQFAPSRRRCRDMGPLSRPRRPPWPYGVRDEDPSHRGVRPYPTMSLEQIRAFDVASILHQDAVVWLWIPNFHLTRGVHTTLLQAWGVEPRSILTWVKDRMGNGDWLRGQTEQCIMAARGKPTVTLTNQTTLLHAPVRGHSVKPIEFCDLVETLCPSPRYADLFSRFRHNEKWDCHGDEAPFAEAAE
jgi:N6-adenosine-specific RNA methylase IME4